jgi:hypothetical protein
MATQLQYGDIVTDREDPEGRAIVVSTPSETISDWYVMGVGHTVADDNPTYPSDDPVVVVLWESQLNDEFPYYTGVCPLPPSLLSSRRILDLLPRLKTRESHHGISGRAFARLYGFKTHTFQASLAG